MAKKAGKNRLPKKECCLDRPRCMRCPIRALAEGTMPAGYTVKRRRLVRIEELDTGAGVAADDRGAGTEAKKAKKGKKRKDEDRAGKKPGKGKNKRDGVARAA